MLRRPAGIAVVPFRTVKLCAAHVALASAVLCSHVNAADDDRRLRPAVEADTGQTLAARAMDFLGVHYRFGGNDPDTGLDCSGLVQRVFSDAAGLALPRRAEEISRAGERIERDALQPGDLVFFNTLRQAFSHVGIYIGEGRFVHAPSQGGRVRIDHLRTTYWLARYDGARRIAAPAGQVASGGGSAATSAPLVALAQPDARQASAWRDASRWANQGVVSRHRAPIVDATSPRDARALDSLLESLERRAPATAALGSRGTAIASPAPRSTPVRAEPAAASTSSLWSPTNPPGVLN